MARWLCTLSLLSFLALQVGAQQQCLKDAWAAYNSKDYRAAISAADRCIDDFGGQASKEEAALRGKSEPQPPTGKVDGAAERNAIFSRWAINDVSAAFFVKGRSAEFLYKNGSKRHKTLAEEAYQGAINLSYGRVWDPQGWFWAPKEAAENRLPLK
jgi:outer membrane protein assembly factor BamD (BamD/ComL family)